MFSKQDTQHLLTDAEEQYKFLIESVKDYAIFMLDIYGNIVTWNKGAERIKGYIAAEVIGKHFSIFYTKQDIENGLPEEELRRAKKDERFEHEGWRVKKDKSFFWANVIITPIYNYENHLIGYSKVTRDLTEQKKHEQKLVELQKQHSLLIEGIEAVKDYAIILLDENGYVTNWNLGAERIKGYKPKEILGRHFSNFYPKDAVDAGYPEYELEKAILEGRFEDEGWRVKKDGTLFWANVILTPIFQNNKISGFTKVTQDLTHKMHSEKKQKEVEDKHKLILNSVKDYGIFMLDPEGYITSWNTGAELIKGYNAEEILGKHFSRFYTKKQVDEGYPDFELKEAAKIGRFEDQGWRVKKDGSIFWANVTITPIFKEDRLIGFSKVTRDLTEQKKIEKALKESEERYRLLVDGVKDYGIFMIDPHGYINTWNKGAKKMTGFEADEVLGKHFSIFYDMDAIKAGYPEYELSKAKEIGRFEYEGWRMKKDGTKYWANVIVNPIINNDRLIGFSKVAKDLTDIKKAESDLIKKNAELSRVNSDLDSFIYTASHDLKAPISNIEGLLSALTESLPDKFNNQETVTNLLSMMDTSINRFRRTIYDLTEITKLQRNILEGPTEVEVEEILADVKDSIAPLIDSTEANITFKSNDGNNTIAFTQAALRAILYNLISNAIKYRHPDRKPEVNVTLKNLSEYYFIQVKDNGLGIPIEFKDKIFSMFKRFHDHVEGTGVGLFIVKRIVDNYEGKIEIESSPGIGTSFNIYLKK